MLHAISGKKTRLYQRYLGHREPGEKRVMEEDELTALLMGPLAFFSPGAVACLWRTVVGSPTDWPEGEPSRASVEFWPRRTVSRGYVEPDLLVSLHWDEGVRRLLLVEFKWRAPLSGERQLHNQWKDFLTPDERRQALHVFIAPEVSHGLNALADEDVWDGRLLLRSWLDVLNGVQELKDNADAPLGKWARQIEAVLSLLQIHPFRGFRSLVPPLSTPSAQLGFWYGSDGKPGN
ncbi:hypothetical protein GYM54_01385 [Pseudomonas sp. MTM4]|uniref:hypothetical protein n=1 Tax=unclassified Pseudomonas TaxID=196821 RepID=UPI0018D20995|nr:MULTISPECIES: hypothetical protein [unclassified Pseudomonas]MBC8648391.1 hypothetical protein [Pseudomonas sp. MT4]QXY90336.1 hypothetical protein GYM54_01385 [Pseudomonas sp. MTM4]